MKLRNTRTKEVYDSLPEAKAAFCISRKMFCKRCPLSVINNGRNVSCRLFAKWYPDEAVSLMGMTAERK